MCASRRVMADYPSRRRRSDRWTCVAISSLPVLSILLGFTSGITTPLGNRAEYEYDEQSNRTVQRDALGRETRRGDPALCATRSTAAPPGPAPGAFRSVAHPQRTGEYASGAFGRKTPHLRNLTAPRDERVVHKAGLSGAGKVLARTLPLGQTETFTYDAVGNQLSRTDFNGEQSTFAYDVNGQQISASFADGETVTTSYTCQATPSFTH